MDGSRFRITDGDAALLARIARLEPFVTEQSAVIAAQADASPNSKASCGAAARSSVPKTNAATKPP